MEKREPAKSAFREKRASPRTLVDRYYSVQLAVTKETPAYQFKLRDISAGGLCIAVRRDSELLSHLKVGDAHPMRYAPAEAPGQLQSILTEIRHITFCREGPYKNHYLVGLAILNDEKSE